MPIIWNPYLVVLSILVAIFGSITALAHANRMRESTGLGAVVWMMTGGITLGLVIWAMHFIGMLAFHLSIPVFYDAQLTLLSVLPAVAAALLGFYLLRTKKMHFGRIAGDGLVMGLGISAMHYTGMAALEMLPPIIYDPVIVSTSVGIAVLAAYGALFIVYAGEKFQLPSLVYHGLGGLVMGLSISGMHYTAMAGTYFPLGSISLGDSSHSDPTLLPLFVSISLFFLLGLGTLANLFEQRVTRQKDHVLQLQMLHKDMEERARTMALAMTEKLRSRQHALSAISQGVLITDAQQRITYVNDAFEKITGYAKTELMGGNCGALLQGTGTNPATVAELRATLNADLPFQGEILNYRKDGTPFWNELSITPIHDSEGRLTQFVGVQRDITERKQTEQREHIRNQVLEQLAKGAPLPNILDALARSVEASYSATLCSILLLDEEGRHLMNGVAPSLPEEYSRTIHGIAIGPCTGSCGTAAFRKERVIVSDISSDPLWVDYRELALLYGLQACWSQPILSSTDQVLGTFAMYYKEIHVPNGPELATISDAANIACIAIEHVRTQQALHIAATTFETQEGIFITDSNKEILRINQAFTSIYGYSIEDVIGSTPSILQSSRSEDDFYKAMSESLQRDNYWAGEVCDQRKNGEAFPVWLTITAVTEEGCITHYVGTFSDITNYKHTQDELQKYRYHLQELVDEQTANLRDSTSRIHAILNTVAEGIITVDERGIVETFNPAAEQIFGYATTEVVGRNINILMPEPYHSQHDGYLEYFRITGEMHIIGKTLEVIGQRKDGGTFPLELTVSMIQLGEGRFFTGILRDITERRQAEDQLDRFFELSPDLLCIASLDGYFKRINHAFTKTLGWSTEEFLARPFLDFVHPDDRDATLNQVENLIADKRILKLENRYLHKNGSWRLLSWTAVAANGGLRFANARDITDRRVIEKKLHAQSMEIANKNLELERASRMKSEFLATMSHEIRTPMNGVIGMVDVLHQTSLNSDQMEMVDTIRESAFSLLGIIEDILDFSKIEAGKLKLEQEPTDVAGVVEKVCVMLDHLAETKAVELLLFTDPAIPATLLSDAQRLRQIVINLASNAIKFSSGQSRPGRVSIQAVLVEHTAQQVVVEIRVIDHGIGIDQETLARLFTPFTQAEASTTRRFGGTGLGLTIAHNLVQLMGGEIKVQSSPDKGSIFIVRLPFIPVPNNADDSATPSLVAGLSCLVIGGKEGMADHLAVYLESAGAVVEQVLNLAAAWEHSVNLLSGPWVWLIDAGNTPPLPEELYAIINAQPEQNIRLVVIGRGKRRRPRKMIDNQMVVVDRNVLTQQKVIQAVAIAAGLAQEEMGMPYSEEVETAFIAPSCADALRQGRLILVAEDNPINQKIIKLQFALLGFVADVASDGHEAMERWRSGDYALLLTDLHMPKMDGYQLTAAIRAEETSARHIVIIAWTANAIKGEELHCLDVGMDDYLSKPTPLANLKAMLNKWLSDADSTAQPVDAATLADVSITPAKLATASKPLDVRVLAALVGDNPEVLNEFLQDFRSSATQIAAEIKTAYAAGEAVQVGALAHKLKSPALAVGALELGELCTAIEQAGKAVQIEVLTALLSHFEVEMAAVNNYLDIFGAPGNIRDVITRIGKTMTKNYEIKILVLDDESFMLKLLDHMLASQGFIQVTTCDSGRGALEWIDCSDSPPDMILLDLNMPEMDGMEFVRHLEERSYTGSLILISGEDERMLQTVEKLVQAHRISILGHLHKPVNPIDLSALLEKWMPPSLSGPRMAKKAYEANEVRSAILGGELINYYQPKVEVVSGKVVGVECLVRWRHPQNGMVFPDQFISVAEEHGLIDDLTDAVIGEAFLQTKCWQNDGLHLRVAVNISMDNLASLAFADKITAAAFSAGIVPGDIVLEVTESKLMKNSSASLETLTRLRMKRFSLSIDDFGTGNSSLIQLRDIPFDELKVDRGFVHGAASNETLRAIFSSSLGLAKQLGMKTVAEGVENRIDWDFLRSTGCDLAQGYFIAKPMPPGEISGWISAWEANIEKLMGSVG